MNVCTIDTKLFGEIEIAQPEGLVEDFNITLGGKDMIIDFQVFEDVANDSTIKTIENMLDNIPLMYEKGKKAIIDGMDSNAVIKGFIDDYFYDDDIDVYLDFFGADSGEDGTIDCTFDFSLPEEYTDQLLVICFNDKHEIFYITHES